MEREKKAELLSRSKTSLYRRTDAFLEALVMDEKLGESGEPFAVVRSHFDRVKEEYSLRYDTAGQTLEYAFDLLEAAFGTGQEIVLFLTEINTNSYGLRFLEQYECERYYRYNASLLYEDRGREILARIESLTP